MYSSRIGGRWADWLWEACIFTAGGSVVAESIVTLFKVRSVVRRGVMMKERVKREEYE